MQIVQDGEWDKGARITGPAHHFIGLGERVTIWRASDIEDLLNQRSCKVGEGAGDLARG